MAKSKNKNKKIIIMLFILLIILIIFIVLLNVLSSKKDDYENDAYKYGTPIYIKEEEKKVYPENIYTIVYRYSGDADLTELYGSIYKFKEYLESLNEKVKDLSEAELETYCIKNKALLKKYVGLESIDEFKKVIKDSNKVYGLEFEKAEMNIETLEINDEKLTCEMKLIYSNNTIISYKLNIFNESSVENIFIYEPLDN